MNTKSMYHKKYYSYLPTANDLDEDVSKVISPMFKKYMTEGYSPREISQIIQTAVSMIECAVILDMNNKNKAVKGSYNLM